MATNTTNFSLKKPAYTDTADIADINGNMDKVDTALQGLGTSLAIISNNNTHAAIVMGQYVYVHGHGSLADGLYTANSSIAANANLTSSNLTAVTIGGMNELLYYISNKTSMVFVSLGEFTSKSSLETALINNTGISGAHTVSFKYTGTQMDYPSGYTATGVWYWMTAAYGFGTFFVPAANTMVYVSDNNGTFTWKSQNITGLFPMYKNITIAAAGTTVTLQSGTRATVEFISSASGACGVATVYGTNSGTVYAIKAAGCSGLTFDTSVTNKLTISGTSTTMYARIYAGDIT